MVRPCFLIVDRDLPGILSSRKLVAETAKFNVITAYSGKEAIETARLFPAIAGVVVDRHIMDLPCVQVIAEIRKILPKIPIALIETTSEEPCPGADYVLDRYTPEELLATLRTMEPAASEAIEQNEIRLEEEEGRQLGKI